LLLFPSGFSSAEKLLCQVATASTHQSFGGELHIVPKKMLAKNLCPFYPTVDGRNPVNNGITYLSTGAGFLPSTLPHVLEYYYKF